jgi:Protein of unknown function (DUF1822)
MLNNHLNIEAQLSDSEPISIALDDALHLHTSASTIDTQCQSIIGTYLQTNLGLDVAVAYPTDIQFTPFITQLVTGFVLTIANTRIVFIPSEDLDYCGFEIEQEWVDLSNWAADYYVPVQVDLEGKFINIWGFISHRDVQEQGELDRISRTYIIDSQYLSDDVADLWLTCELIASGEMSPARGAVSPIPELLPQTAQGLIDTLCGHRLRSVSGRESIFSPRLDLSFAQWGGILNQPKFLELYLNPAPEKEPVSISLTIPRIITRLSDWLDGESAAICEDWKSIETFIYSTQPVPAFRSSSDKLKPRLAPDHFRGVPLDTAETIDREIKLLYATSELSIVQIPAHISQPDELLVYLIQHTNNDNLRLQALEYLWTIAPEHPLVQSRRIKDLGMTIQGHSIGLMIAALEKTDDKLIVLPRVYPIGVESKLPPNLQLWLFDEHGNSATKQPIVSRTNPLDPYIQLQFLANRGDLFSISVKLNDSSISEPFIA